MQRILWGAVVGGGRLRADEGQRAPSRFVTVAPLRRARPAQSEALKRGYSTQWAPAIHARVDRQELRIAVEQREAGHVDIVFLQPHELHVFFGKEIELRMRHHHTLGRAGGAEVSSTAQGPAAK